MDQMFSSQENSQAEQGTLSEEPNEQSSGSQEEAKSQLENYSGRTENRYRNTGEMLCISSGYVLAIDQFMLGNSQFISRASKWNPSSGDPISLIRDVVAGFGGLVFEIPNGRYQVVREPRQSLILLVSESEFAVVGGEREAVEGWFDFRAQADIESKFLGKVAVDTRCMVLSDLKLLEATDALDKYRQFRLERQEKAARDYLRELGAAVRYGFSWRGEEFQVYAIPHFASQEQVSPELDFAENEESRPGASSGLVRNAVALQIRR